MKADESPMTDRLSIRIASTNARVSVIAEERIDIDVAGDAIVSSVGNATTIVGGSNRLVVRVPAETDVVIGTTSGRVDISGTVGTVAVTTESGKVTVERAASVDVRSATGRIDIGHCGDRCRLQSEHGAVAVGSCGAAEVATNTGKISLRDVRGIADAHCTNGRIDITMATASDVTAETVTGRISVSLPPGARALRADSGDATSHPAARPADVDCVVTARSVTGRINVVNR
jgi:DUF4097 and DUF4098 domain-containing protein YvlB